MKQFLRIDIWTVVILVLGIPNFFVVYDATNMEGQNSFDLSIILRLSTFSLVGIVTFLVLLSQLRINKRAFDVCYIPICFYGLQFINILLSQEGGDLLKSSYRLIEYFVFLMFLIVFYQKKNWLGLDFFNQFVKCSMVYVFFTIVIGIVVTPDKIFSALEMGNSYFRLGGSVIHPNTLGNIVAIFILWLLHVSNIRARFFLGGGLFIIVLLTYSRGALLALIVGLALPYLLYSKNRGGAFVFLCLTSSFVVYIAGTFLLEVLSRGQGVEGFITLSGRTVVWLSSIDIITANLKNLLFGISFGEPSELVGEIMEKTYGVTYWKSHNAHNDFLQAWLGGGVIFFIFTLWLYKKIFGLINGLDNRKDKYFFSGILVVVTLYGLSMTSLNYYFNTISGITWLMYLCLKNEELNKKLI